MTDRNALFAPSRADRGTSQGRDAAVGTDLFARFLDLCILRDAQRHAGRHGAAEHDVLDAANRSLAQLGLPRDDAAVTELRMTVDLLLNGSIAAAAEVWRDHLGRPAGAASRS